MRTIIARIVIPLTDTDVAESVLQFVLRVCGH